MGLFNRTSRFAAPKFMDSSSTIDEKTTGSPVSKVAIPGKDVDFGTSSTIKTFYEGKDSGGGYYDWVESPPKQLAKKVAKAHDRVAIKIFKVKDNDQETMSGRTPLKIHQVEIQSPILVAALKDIMKDENVFLETSETAKFKEPFKPLFFCHDKIISLFNNTAEGTLRQNLKLLVQVMTDLFSGFMAKLKNLRSSGLISYQLAWTYFPRSSLIYSNSTECTRVCRVVDTDYECGKKPRLAISCEEIAFDGEKFAWRPTQLHISSFKGNLPVTALSNYPLNFHEGKEDVRARLTERAKKVLEYQDLKYCEYEGVALMNKSGSVKKHNVSIFLFGCEIEVDEYRFRVEF